MDTLIDMAPDNTILVSPFAGDPDQYQDEPKPKRGRPAGQYQKRPGPRDTPQYLGLVATSEKEIEKNNRLALLIEVHQRRQAKQQPKEIEQMATNKKGTCESCGNTNISLQKNYGVFMCSTCSAVHSSVRNRPETVASAIKRTGSIPQFIEALGINQAAMVTVESELLDKLCSLVGYTGKSGDELFSEIEKAVTNSYRDELIVSTTAITEICKCLDIQSGDTQYKDVVLAVAQTAATLEHSENELDVMKHALDVAKRPSPSVHTLPSVDSSLLDLALDALSGTVTGLDAGRIKSLRVAAGAA